jgi:thiosulfate/3-mercaptopyruvate sulfurtransferase
MQKYYGHQNAAVLDGGLKKWIDDGFPISSGIEVTKGYGIPFISEIDPTRVLETKDIEQLRLNPDILLIDARSSQRFRGEIEPIDPIAGHIPGAVNRFHGENLSEGGSMKPVELLKAEFEELLHGRSSQNVIVYCGSGVTSCHHLLAMEVAGLTGARLYAGSWSEWIRDPSHPIVTGQ